MAADDEGRVDRALDDIRRATAELAKADPERETPEGWMVIRVSFGEAMSALDLQLNRISAHHGLSSGRDRILAYLRSRVGEVVTGSELAAVAGIGEWARRVRELRVEHGWPVQSGLTRDDLRPSEYVLTADEPDLSLTADWKTAKEVRNLRAARGSRASGKDRLLAYLKAVHPRPADKERLAYVTHGMQEWPRRMRELVEEGWQIDSHLDDGALAPGDYRLTSLDQLPARPREAIKLRHEVFERDGYTCRDCGRSPRTDPVRLQAHHLHPVHQGGDNDPSNLVTLCSVCHAGRHAIGEGSVKDELLHAEAERSY